MLLLCKRAIVKPDPSVSVESCSIPSRVVFYIGGLYKEQGQFLEILLLWVLNTILYVVAVPRSSTKGIEAEKDSPSRRGNNCTA